MKKTSPSTKKAFTLIEILVVVGIIVLLVGFSTSLVKTASDAQGKARAMTDIEVIANAIEEFRSIYGDYPRISCAADEKLSAAQLYQCLVGKLYMTVQDSQIVFLPLSPDATRRPLIDASKMNLGNTQGKFGSDVDPEDANTFFADPWGQPYLYMFDSNLIPGAITTWRSPSYILLSKGPDEQAFSVGSFYIDGIMRDMEQYRSNESNVDNIVRGMDN